MQSPPFRSLKTRISRSVLLLATLLSAIGVSGQSAESRSEDWVLREGRLFANGERVFLKIAKPLRNFADPKACRRLREELPVLQGKGYNAVALNCYWHQFDRDGDGQLDFSPQPLSELIDAIHALGMFPCLSVETYGVGGGTIPAPLWERFPDAAAINAEGKPVIDHEYKTEAAVPSLLHEGYREAVHRFIGNLVGGVPFRKILYYETTVEPQFIGRQDLDYSVSAKRAYEVWLAHRKLDGPAWPEGYPIPAAFRRHPLWLEFRAQALADWINQDAAAFRRAAGADALIAVDYLETCGSEMPLRNGNSLAFLRALTCANVIQVNWHWNLRERGPNVGAYDNVRRVMQETGRPWAISEHMTLNGNDFKPEEVPSVLRNALAQGTGFGWEFVNPSPSTRSKFCLYNDDWSPKPVISEVDQEWPKWLAEALQSKP
jgi:hypothetical protein